MEARVICDLFREAADSLSKSVCKYWPANGDSEIGEGNQVLHVASVLMKNGWYCWSEVHWDLAKYAKGQTEDGKAKVPRLDLLAWHDESRSLLMLEAKRLYNPAKVAEMAYDIQRIAGFYPINHVAESDRLIPAQRFGALTASTWQSTIVNWWGWKGPGSGADPWPEGTSRWDSSNPDLKKANRGLWESRGLRTADKDGRTDLHHLLYAVWKLP